MLGMLGVMLRVLGGLLRCVHRPCFAQGCREVSEGDFAVVRGRLGGCGGHVRASKALEVKVKTSR